MTKESSESDSMIVFTTIIMGVCTIVAAIIPVYLVRGEETKSPKVTVAKKAPVSSTSYRSPVTVTSQPVAEKVVSNMPNVDPVAIERAPEATSSSDKPPVPIPEPAEPIALPVEDSDMKKEVLSESKPELPMQITIEPKVLFSDTKEAVLRPKITLTEEGKATILLSSSRPYTKVKPGVYQLEVQHRSCQTKKLEDFSIPSSSSHFVLEILLDPK